MGFRLQRRINLGGGLGFNVSKSGLSPGIRSKHGSVSAKGFSIRTGIPGLSFRSSWGSKSNDALLTAIITGIFVVAIYLLRVLLVLAWYLITLVYSTAAWLVLTGYDYVGYRMDQKRTRRLSDTEQT